MIKFAYTILYVQNVANSLNFYEKAFGWTRKFITPDGDYGELISGETTLSFAAIGLANSNLNNGFIESNLQQRPFGIEIGFVVENVPAAVEMALAAGAVLEKSPAVKPWGQTVAYVRDLDGFLIELCTAMA